MVNLIGHFEPKQTKTDFALIRIVLNLQADIHQTAVSRQNEMKMDFFLFYFQSSIPLTRKRKKKEKKALHFSKKMILIINERI